VRAGIEAGFRDIRAKRIDGYHGFGHVPRKHFDHRQHARQFDVGGYKASAGAVCRTLWSRRRASDIYDRGAPVDKRIGVKPGTVERHVAPTVVKGVWRDVEDPRDER
jgi:hypothetical protein